MSKVSDMLDSLRPARDEQGSPVHQSEYDRLKRQLAAMKDGQTGRSGDSTKNDHIFLQVADDGEWEGEVTWCSDRIHDEDVEYIRFDLAQQQLAAAQARIDELMLEYCPDEMTEEQLEEWGKHQRAVKVPK